MASKRRIRRRICSSKKRFEDVNSAMFAIRSLKKDTGTLSFFVPYKCKFCKKFHFGRTKGRSNSRL